MNNISVLARLVKPPQSAGTTDNPFAYGNIAINSWCPVTKSKKSIFFYFNAYGRSATFLMEYCGKGDMVCMAGELVHGKPRDGDTHQSLVLKVQNVAKASPRVNSENDKPNPTEDKFILRKAPKTIDKKIEEELEDNPF